MTLGPLITVSQVAFGCKGDRGSPVAGIMRLAGEAMRPQVVYIKTR